MHSSVMEVHHFFFWSCSTKELISLTQKQAFKKIATRVLWPRYLTIVLYRTPMVDMGSNGTMVDVG